MRIILLVKINNLGNIGDVVDVSSGYARNYLIPTSQAVLATKINIESFKSQRHLLENDVIKIRSEAEFRISKIKEIGFITIASKSGISGKLFGSIGTREISSAITNAGVAISRHNVRLPNGKIRYIGDYVVIIKIYHEISTKLNIHVVSE